MLRRLRYQLYERVLRFPLHHFDRTATGQVIAMMTGELEPVGGFIGEAFALPISQGGTLLTIFVFMFVQDPDTRSREPCVRVPLRGGYDGCIRWKSIIAAADEKRVRGRGSEYRVLHEHEDENRQQCPALRYRQGEGFADKPANRL